MTATAPPTAPSTALPPRRAVLAGCARDCAAHLPVVLAHMERIAALFDEAAFVFVENDSSDPTASLLRAFADRQLNATVEHLDGLAQRLPRRTERLAFARNRVLEIIDDSSLHTFDLLVLMDLDDINRVVPGAADWQRALAWLAAHPERAAVFANQPDGYYDLWALRHPERCPGDVWEAVLDHHLAHPGASDQQAFDAGFAPRQFALPREAAPLAVDSAFGGLGLYKMAWALQGRGHYAGTLHKRVSTPQGDVEVHGEVCEHVAFHARLRAAGGVLHVLPWWVNLSVRRGFPPGAWRHLYRLAPAGR